MQQNSSVENIPPYLSFSFPIYVSLTVSATANPSITHYKENTENQIPGREQTTEKHFILRWKSELGCRDTEKLMQLSCNYKGRNRYTSDLSRRTSADRNTKNSLNYFFCLGVVIIPSCLQWHTFYQTEDLLLGYSPQIIFGRNLTDNFL